MVRLYELSAQIRQLEQFESEQLKPELDRLDGEFKVKAINIGKYIMELLAELNSIESEIKRLTEKQKPLLSKVGFLKQYLFDNMLAGNIDRIDDPVVKLTIRINPPSCEVKEVMTLPVEFRRLMPEQWIPDRTAIIKHFKDTGEIITGAELHLNNRRLEIND